MSGSGPGAATVVVANPGHLPSLSHAASGYDRMGRLRAYVAPFGGFAERSGVSLAPPFIRRELRRRALPDGIDPRRAFSAASPSELAAVAAGRVGVPGPLRRRLSDRRDRRFDKAVAATIGAGDSAALLCYGAGLETIRRARRKSIATALEYAVHHHAANAAILRAELSKEPAYAASMQFHEASRERIERLDAELDEVDRIIAFSRFSRRTFLDAGIEEGKVVVNQLGIDVARFSGVRRADDDDFRVVFLGVLTQRKGLSYLVDGFEKADISNGELLLVGQPWNGHAPWRGRRRIVHQPWIESREVPSLFARTDVLVLPSLVEGLARVIIEAMAAGVPVIATPNSGAEDVIRDGTDGFVVPIRDADAIAERLTHLHRDPELLRTMSAAARDRGAEFTWDAYAKRGLTILDAITANTAVR